MSKMTIKLCEMLDELFTTYDGVHPDSVYAVELLNSMCAIERTLTILLTR